MWSCRPCTHGGSFLLRDTRSHTGRHTLSAYFPPCVSVQRTFRECQRTSIYRIYLLWFRNRRGKRMDRLNAKEINALVIWRYCWIRAANDQSPICLLTAIPHISRISGAIIASFSPFFPVRRRKENRIEFFRFRETPLTDSVVDAIATQRSAVAKNDR